MGDAQPGAEAALDVEAAEAMLEAADSQGDGYHSTSLPTASHRDVDDLHNCEAQSDAEMNADSRSASAHALRLSSPEEDSLEKSLPSQWRVQSEHSRSIDY